MTQQEDNPDTNCAHCRMGDSSTVVGEPPVTSQHQQEQHQVSQWLSQVKEGQLFTMYVDVDVIVEM